MSYTTPAITVLFRGDVGSMCGTLTQWKLAGMAQASSSTPALAFGPFFSVIKYIKKI